MPTTISATTQPLSEDRRPSLSDEEITVQGQVSRFSLNTASVAGTTSAFEMAAAKNWNSTERSTVEEHVDTLIDTTAADNQRFSIQEIIQPFCPVLLVDSAATSQNTSPAASEIHSPSSASTFVLEDPTIEDKTSSVEDNNTPDTLTTIRNQGPVISQIANNNTLTRKQNALVLHAVNERYILVADHAVPLITHDDEILVKVNAIGLNPIDWKAPAFNFGIPSLPWVFGRDFAGVIVQTSTSSRRLQIGDVVLVPSTDYRDIRKAAFQEYAVTTHYNAAKIPAGISKQSGASLGVAFVAAALALGVSFGLDFSTAAVPGPNLRRILSELDIEQIPVDIRDECLSNMMGPDMVQKGDWIALWGASTTTGYITLQLAKLCGLRVICIADVARRGSKLYEAGADLLVDRLDTDRAVEIIRGVTENRLRFGLDIVGRETATILQRTLSRSDRDAPLSHLLGFTGIPKEKDPRIRYHTVPIKIFHSSPAVGEGLVMWLESLLETKALTPPEVVVRRGGGLADINDALEILRSGEASGQRIVIDLEESGLP